MKRFLISLSLIAISGVMYAPDVQVPVTNVQIPSTTPDATGKQSRLGAFRQKGYEAGVAAKDYTVAAPGRAYRAAGRFVDYGAGQAKRLTSKVGVPYREYVEDVFMPYEYDEAVGAYRIPQGKRVVQVRRRAPQSAGQYVGGQLGRAYSYGRGKAGELYDYTTGGLKKGYNYGTGLARAGVTRLGNVEVPYTSVTEYETVYPQMAIEDLPYEAAVPLYSKGKEAVKRKERLGEFAGSRWTRYGQPGVDYVSGGVGSAVDYTSKGARSGWNRFKNLNVPYSNVTEYETYYPRMTAGDMPYDAEAPLYTRGTEAINRKARLGEYAGSNWDALKNKVKGYFTKPAPVIKEDTSWYSGAIE